MTEAAPRHAGTCMLVVALVCVCYVALAPFFLAHYDLGWHLAAGDLIRLGGEVPRYDPWSFTAGTNQWFNLSWLWDVLQSRLLQTAGFNAIIIETILFGALIAGGLFTICVGNGATPIAAGVSVFISCILYPTYALPLIFLGATPGVVTLLCCVIFYGACLRPQALWLPPLVMLVWVNMHGGFIVGPCVIGLFTAFAGDLIRFRRYLLCLAFTLAATLVNPRGVFVYQGLLGTLEHFALDYITEWRPYFSIVSVPVAIPCCLYLLMFTGLELLGRGTGRIAARLLAWCFMLAGLWKLRYLTIFFLFATVPVALHLSQLRPSLLRARFDNRPPGIVGLFVLCCLPLLYWRSVPANIAFPTIIFPTQETDYLTEHLPRARLLNHWNYGGFIIFKTRGAVPVFIDGRSATAYPDRVLRDFLPLTDTQVEPARWERVLREYGIDTIMWPKSHLGLAQFLTGTGQWTLAYTGPIANIYVRTGENRDQR